MNDISNDNALLNIYSLHLGSLAHALIDFHPKLIRMGGL